MTKSGEDRNLAKRMKGFFGAVWAPSLQGEPKPSRLISKGAVIVGRRLVTLPSGLHRRLHQDFDQEDDAGGSDAPIVLPCRVLLSRLLSRLATRFFFFFDLANP